MNTLSTIAAMLKEVGTPAVTIIGFAWVIFKLNAFKTEFKADMSVMRAELKADNAVLRAEVKTDISELRADVSGLKADVADLKTDVSELKADVSELKADMKSVKGNHLPHIEAAIHELSKGTPNEAHVKAILDLSHKADLE